MRTRLPEQAKPDAVAGATNYNTFSDAVAQFADALYRDAGVSIQPIPDGHLHRFDDPEGKRNNLACWYVLHLDGYPAGAYGNWRTGYQGTWRANSRQQLSLDEKSRIDAAILAARVKRDSDKAQAQAQAAERAQRLWCDAIPATVDNPYLKAKHIPALSLRQSSNLLLVALRDIDGVLINLQTISPAGEKRFLKGGQITGCFALTGAVELPEDGELYICEGFATAATIASTLRVPVVAAMNVGNLLPVATAIRKKYLRLAIVIAADNDHRTPGNPGISKGKETARAVHGALSWPSVCLEYDCRCTDFNDTARCGRAKQ